MTVRSGDLSRVGQPPYRIIGRPMPVVEDRRFVRGRGRYINDLAFPAMLHIAIVPAPVAHARLLGVDVAEALQAPGVVTVLTGADMIAAMEPIPQELPIPDVVWYPLAVDKIRYAGEWVAAVVATSRAAAEDAAELVFVDFDELEPLVDPKAALLPDAPVLHEAHGTNVVWQERFTWGEVDEAFAAADHVFEYSFRWNRHSGVPLETFGCVSRVDPTGILEIWASHQNPGIQQEVMRVLRLPTAKVHMEIDLGGSYGSKRGVKHVFLTAIAAMRTGRPVKLIEDRIENMQSGDGHGPDRYYTVKVAASSEGLVRALDIDLVEDLGAYCGRGPRQITKPTSAVVGPYRIPAVRYGGHGVLTCKTNQVPFRGAGQSPHNFALERTIDQLARDLGIDRVEIRRRNYIQPDEFPFEIPGGALYDSGNYPGACDMALREAKWEDLLAEQQQAREQGRLFGIGVAGAIEPSGAATEQAEGVQLEIDPRGHVVVTIGFQSAGQAHESMVTQLVCEELGVEPAQVVVQRGHGLAGVLAGAPTGSRMTLMLGTSVHQVVAKIHAKLKEIAAFRLEATPDRIEIRGTDFCVTDDPARTLTLRELAKIAYGPRLGCPQGMEPGLIEKNVFAGVDVVTKRKLTTGAKQFPSYAFDFHVVVAEVDPETCEIALRKYLVVHDCGTVLNPLVVDGFVYGGIGHGVGGALYEHFAYDERGQLQAASFMDYLMPTAAEVPHVELHEMCTPTPRHPYGAKGAAEGAYMTAPSAIASAIEDALAPLDIRINRIPITPQGLFDAMRGRGAFGAGTLTGTSA
jgi:CO/xanthine dehydrogenase Mo-binding subunit